MTPVDAVSRRGSRRHRISAIVRAVELSWRAAWLALVITVICTLVLAVVPVAVALLTKSVVDGLTQPGLTVAMILPTSVGLVLTGLLSAVLPRVTSYVRGISDQSAGVLSQDRLFRSVERFTGLARFEDPGFLDRLRLAQQSTAQTPGQIVHGVLETSAGVVTLSGFLGSLVVLSPWLPAIALATAIPVLIAQLRLARQHAATMWKVSPIERRELFYTMLLSSMAAAKELRLFGTGPFLRRRMLVERKAANAQHRRMDRRDLLTQGVLALLSALVGGAGLLWVIRLAALGQIGVGDVMLFVAAIAGSQTAVSRIAAAIASMHRQLLLFDHYLAVINADPDLPVPASPSALPTLRHGIELRDVWFRYSDHHPWVLRGVTILIPRGQAVALVGRNGSGKSTLVKLLCRFYDPTKGAIFWDGTDLRDVPVEELRHRITAVFQDFMHYDMTAAENIGLGDVDAITDTARITNAAERAGIHDTITALPYGYKTPLTRMFASTEDDADDGVPLSGGQWQRLALARALVRARRDLIILDEPSAGLDAAAEHEIHTRLREHSAGQTSLLISHRLGAVRNAGAILVLSEGEVIEQGTHDELIAHGGEYATLFQLQASGYLPADQLMRGEQVWAT